MGRGPKTISAASKEEHHICDKARSGAEALYSPFVNLSASATEGKILRCGKVTLASEFGRDALPAKYVIALAQVGTIATPSGQSATSQRFPSGSQRTR